MERRSYHFRSFRPLFLTCPPPPHGPRTAPASSSASSSAGASCAGAPSGGRGGTLGAGSRRRRRRRLKRRPWAANRLLRRRWQTAAVAWPKAWDDEIEYIKLKLIFLELFFIVCTLASFLLRSSSSASSSSLARAGGGNWWALADLRFSRPGTGLLAVCFAEKEEEELDVVAEVVAACWQKKNHGSLQVYSAKIYRVLHSG